MITYFLDKLKPKTQYDYTLHYLQKCNKKREMNTVIGYNQNSFMLFNSFNLLGFNIVTNKMRIKFDFEFTSVLVYRNGDVFYASSSKEEIDKIYTLCLSNKNS